LRGVSYISGLPFSIANQVFSQNSQIRQN